MGVQGLWKLLECSGRPINPETLEGKILAVDISIWLNQAIKGARDRQGNAVQNAHLLTLFHRLCKLLFFRIRPIFVFDGEAPLLKKQTLAKRRQRKDNASTEARKTKEKLLKTFLKRQAIKAALLGNKSSNEDFPSLSQVQRKESDDLYALPPLENEDKNSSEEEEEREWEERMNQKQILQEEFFANPSSVDIESEEFNSLPPEVRHEILTDMKEITKRRRTLFEAMPEDSGDFSQYQLKGLLKKNSLNKCIDNVRKEINQQYTGEVQAQFEAEGGFLKEVETRRLVSEDTSHYILIKGINSKEDKKNDDLPTQTVDFNSTQGPKTYLDLKLASARKPKASQTSSGEAAPPSPRTLFAIQEAMMEISSDEELEEKKQPLSEHVGNVSPRTMQAISQVLAEDEAEQSKPKEMLQLHAKERKNRKAMLLVISSSDEEDDRLSTQEGPKTNLDEPFKDNNRVPSSVTLQKSTGNCTFEFTDSQIHHLSNKQNEVKLSETNSLDINSLGIQNEVSLLPLTDAVGKFADVCASLPSINNLLSVTSVVDSSVTPVNANSNRTIQFSSVLKLQTNIGKQDHSPNTAMDSLQSFDETTGIQKMLPSPFGSSATSVSDLQLAKGTTCTEPEMLQSCSNIVSITQTIKPLEVNHPKEDMENFLTKNDLGAMYVPMTPESIVDRDGEYQTNKEEESDSDGSFIEVESCLSSNNKQHMDIREADDTQETSSNLMVTDAIPSKSQDSSVNNLAECFGDDGLPREPGKPLSNEDSRDAESAENEWQDINLNELESLENNLFVQQTSLQAQRQQQERIAASVTGQMYIESQELLRLFGIPFIVAPMEAEAQCAVLDLTDQTSGTITDDSDIWLFGARHVYKNFFTQNKYVEYYQYSDIHNQLGLDRSKFINLAYLLGSDYTEGIPAVGYVSAMEILNEFPGQGLESLLKFKEWWTDAYQNKKMRPNPNDTKVKKKLRELELHPSFPNPAVANAYLKPVVDESKGAFFWGRPDLEQIREFCESRFGWYQSKTDEVLLPVLKQLNTQQTQLRIDSFFRLEQHETIGLKSQRLRRAVTCMKRKEREKDEAEVEAASTLMKSEFCGLKGRKKNTDFESVKKKKLAKSAQDDKDSEEEEGGFIGGKVKTLSPKGCSTKGTGSDAGNLQSIIIHNQGVDVEEPKSSNVDKSSSSSEDDERTVLVKAKPVFQGSKRKPRVKAKRK